jgi:hypothetical protein
MVVVPEDGEDAERRFESPQNGRGGRRRHGCRAANSGDDVISREEDDVGPGTIDLPYDLLQLVEAITRRADMEVAQKGDEKTVLLRGPSWEHEIVAVHLEGSRLEDEGPAGEHQRRSEERQEKDPSLHEASMA